MAQAKASPRRRSWLNNLNYLPKNVIGYSVFILSQVAIVAMVLQGKYQLNFLIEDESVARSELVALSDQVAQTVLWSAVAATAFSVIVAFFTLRATLVPIRTLTRRLESVAEGKTDFHVRSNNGSDAIGQMWAALAKVRTRTTEAFALEQMIEQFPVPVMLANPNDEFRVTYMNRATTEALSSISDALPVKVENMIGQSIDLFHRNPAHQRKILSEPNSKRVEQFQCVVILSGCRTGRSH